MGDEGQEKLGEKLNLQLMAFRVARLERMGWEYDGGKWTADVPPSHSRAAYRVERTSLEDAWNEQLMLEAEAASNDELELLVKKLAEQANVGTDDVRGWLSGQGSLSVSDIGQINAAVRRMGVDPSLPRKTIVAALLGKK